MAIMEEGGVDGELSVVFSFPETSNGFACYLYIQFGHVVWEGELHGTNIFVSGEDGFVLVVMGFVG